MFSWEIYEFLKTAEAATGGVLSKKGLQRYNVCPVNIVKYLRTPILKNVCEKLLIKKLFQRTLASSC